MGESSNSSKLQFSKKQKKASLAKIRLSGRAAYFCPTLLQLTQTQNYAI
jgi:hypothetical protein